MKKVIFLSLTALAALMLTFAFNVSPNKPKADDSHYFYVYGHTWSNDDYRGRQENGSDGVAYVSNVTSVRASSSSSSARNAAKSKAVVQFDEAFEAHYSKEIYMTYFSGGVNTVQIFDSRDAAEKDRRETIADYKDDDAIVRYFNDFDVLD
ncbi:MAG: hypothetical protein JXQ87_08410 [Bacteroidia bacterium]